jgi:hypothetical protein
MRSRVFAGSVGFVLLAGALAGVVTKACAALPVWLVVLLCAMALPVLAVAFLAAAWSGKAILEGRKRRGDK